jgi:aryl-alcohol dehydrogenase-like predicted oxidoreductase
MLAGNRTRDGGRHTTRSSTDAFTDYLYDRPTDFDVVDAVNDVAAERGVPSAQIGLAWLLQRPGVTAPIVGSTKEQHLKDALAAEEITLSAEEVERLEKPYVPHPVLGHF